MICFQDEKDRRQLGEGEEELGVHGGHVRRRVQTSQPDHRIKLQSFEIATQIKKFDQLVRTLNFTLIKSNMVEKIEFKAINQCMYFIQKYL